MRKQSSVIKKEDIKAVMERMKLLGYSADIVIIDEMANVHVGFRQKENGSMFHFRTTQSLLFLLPKNYFLKKKQELSTMKHHLFFLRTVGFQSIMIG
jgi:hypothetical protein